MFITFPLAYPIGKLLDKLLGEDLVGYDRQQLLELMKLTTRYETNKELAEDLKIAVGAMQIIEKKVEEVMTPIEDVFMLSTNMVLNSKNITEILRRGYTRIPVYEDGDRNQICSLLFIKDLALLDPNDNFTVSTVCKYYQHALRFIDQETPLHSMLEEFKNGDYHLAIVQNDEEDVLGIITLEDIVEEILQSEIIDETDAIIDNKYRQKRKRKMSRHHEIKGVETEYSNISENSLKVIGNWLRSNYSIFGSSYIEPRALNSLIKNNLHQVDVTHGGIDSRSHHIHRINLYTSGIASRRFILILEGQGNVEFESGMKFHVNSWEAFGSSILTAIEANISMTRFNGSTRSLFTGKLILWK